MELSLNTEHANNSTSMFTDITREESFLEFQIQKPASSLALGELEKSREVVVD